EPPRRIVLTWGWDAPGDATPPGASRVEVDFVPDGDGTIPPIAAQRSRGRGRGGSQRGLGSLPLAARRGRRRLIKVAAGPRGAGAAGRSGRSRAVCPGRPPAPRRPRPAGRSPTPGGCACAS